MFRRLFGHFFFHIKSQECGLFFLKRKNTFISVKRFSPRWSCFWLSNQYLWVLPRVGKVGAGRVRLRVSSCQAHWRRRHCRSRSGEVRWEEGAEGDWGHTADVRILAKQDCDGYFTNEFEYMYLSICAICIYHGRFTSHEGIADHLGSDDSIIA